MGGARDGGAVITEYEYRYSRGAMVTSSATWTDVADGSDSGSSTADETGVTISSLINGTQYAFEVRAVNRVGGGTKAGPVTATPFTVSALVSNIGQSNDASSVVAILNDISQGFTTGASPAILTSVEIRVSSDEIRRRHPRVTLRRGSPTSAVVAGLRAPEGTIGITTTNFTYTARANTMLAASTTYYVVLDNGENSVTFPLTNSDNEDSGGQTGWSMADGHGRRLSDSGSAYTDYTSALMIRVNGALTTTAPGAPQDFEATAGDEEVTLSWGAPASDGGAAITEYEYRYSEGAMVSASATWTDVTDGSDDGDSTADEIGVTISGLTNDTEYAFEVRAVNSAGEGTAAGPLTATPAAACAAPNFGTRRNIWTGALTVADFIESGASAHGFNANNGVLDDKTFTLGANNYEIRFLAHLPNEGSIWLRLATNLTTLEKSVLKLHVCDVALDFSAAQHIAGVKAYLFDVRSIDSIDWSSIDSRTLYLSLPANTAATGTPTITAPDTDPTTVGTTLTATTGDIADVDGLPSTFTYQWSRVDADGTSNEEAIAGATESTYVMAADDVGKKVTVALTFTDTLGSEETRTSAVYPSSGTIVAAAATTGALVSNIGQTVSGNSATLGTTRDLSQGFTTATTAGTLDSIEVKFAAANDGSAHPTVTLHKDSPISTAIATLTAPSGTIAATAANYKYTAPSNTTLIAATTYYVVLEGSDDDLAPQTTSSDNEDSGGQTGWSVANGYGFRTATSVGAFSTSIPALLIRVNGTAKAVTVPGVPTSFMATAGDGEVTLSWGAPANIGGGAITKYRYRHSEGSTVVTTASWTDVPDGSDDGDSTADETGVTISSLTNGTEYAFEVRAVNSAGEGTAAGSVTATPAAPACAAPNFGTRRNFWTGSLTVGTTSAVTYGFNRFGGSLDDKTFTIGSNNYEIDGVFMFTTGPSAGDISFSLKDSDLTSAEKAALRLHVCNAPYDFSAAILTNSTHTYTFSADLDWSSLSSRTLYLSLPANHAATGTPTISGTATVGQMLTAVTTALADSDGLPTTFTYQWVRVDGSNETDIAGATSSTYTLAGADQGKKVKVKVSFIDDLNGMETRTSAAYPATSTVAAACAAPNFGTRRNFWTGSLTVGMTSAVSYGFDSDDGSLDDKTFTIGSNNYEIDSVFILTAGPSAGYIRFSLKDSDLTSAEKAALRLHVCNADYNFSAAILTNNTHTYTFSADLDWSGISSRTLYLSLPANHAATGTPTISGTATVGQMLTAETTALADTDGLPTTFTYQWVRVDGSNETDIAGATSSTYTLAGADQGKKVKVKVSFTDDLNGMETRTSAAYPATSTVAGATLPTVTVAAGSEVDEGEDAEFTLTLSAAAPTGGQSVSYNLALTNPNPVADRAHVAAADLGVKTATVAAGETTATVTVATVDVDDLVSKNSTLTLSLTAAAGYTLGSTAAAEVTIDDTTTATVTYSGGACSTTVSEGAGSVDLGVQLDKDVAFQISILFIDIPATAGAGNDYVAPALADRSLVFPALTRTKNFTVGIVDNEQLENDEVFDIELFRNGLDAAITINTGCTGNFLTVTIEDDDTAELSISAPTPVTEGDDIQVTVAPPTGSCVIPFQVMVMLTPSGDTNGLGSADAKSLRLSPCSSGTANFATADDSVKTAERSLLFTLSLPANADSRITLPATPSASVTVTDDETLKVTGVAVTSTPSSGSTYGAGETLSFTATFNGPVTVTGTPQLPFSLGGVTKQAAYASGSDSTALVFSYTVAAGDNDADGISWAADALALNGGTIKFMTSVVANRVDAALTHAAGDARSGHKVDTPPVLSTPTVNVTALVLTYNEALDTGSEPAGSAFTVKVGGTAVSLATSNPVAVAGKTVTLILAAAVAAADTVTVSYAVPGSNPLQDAGGADAPAFSDLAVTNGTGNTAPAFANDTAARSFTETVGDAAVTTAGNVGAVVTATDGRRGHAHLLPGGGGRGEVHGEFK